MLAKLIAAGAVGALVGAAVVASAAPNFNLRGNRFAPLAYEQLTPVQKAYADKELAGGRNLGFMFLPNYRAWVIFASAIICFGSVPRASG